MATPWDLIADSEYRSWLLETPMTVENYNEATLADRRSLRTQFEQRQQQPLVMADIQALAAFARESMEAKTEHKAMSEASEDFAKLLLGGRNITVEVGVPCTDEGNTADPAPYPWTVDTTDNTTLKKGEHQGTPGAKDWFTQNFLQNSGYDLHVVTGEYLPTIKGDRKSARGKGDLAIGIARYMELVDSPYEQAYGLVELKTDQYGLKNGQNLLELVSLSSTSRLRKAVSLLATDCGSKWQLYHFKDATTIYRRTYQHGRKCWEDFKELLDTAETRNVRLAKRKHTHPLTLENDDDQQDLGGFEGEYEDDGKTKALERQAMLESLASQLEKIYGEHTSVPYWARAEATCPNYYAYRLLQNEQELSMNLTKALFVFAVFAMSAEQANALTFWQKINPFRFFAQIIVNRFLPADELCTQIEEFIEDAAGKGDDFVACQCEIVVENTAIVIPKGEGTASCILNPVDLCPSPEICAESASFFAAVSVSIRDRVNLKQLRADITPVGFPKITITGSADISLNPASIDLKSCSVMVEGEDGQCTCTTDGCKTGEVSYDCSSINYEGTQGPKSDGCVSMATV